MGKTTAINIGLHIKGKVIDLRIPYLVKEAQLKGIVATALSQLKIQLPEQYALKLLNKKVDIREDIVLSRYPLSDGDQFAVVFHSK